MASASPVITILATTNYASGSRVVFGKMATAGTYSTGVPITPAMLGLSDIQIFWPGSPEPINGHATSPALVNQKDTAGAFTAQWLIKAYSSAGTEYATGKSMTSIDSLTFFAIGSA